MADEMEVFNDRLLNWRRAFGDHGGSYLSSTLVFCQYARANMKRKKETDSQRYWRELEELRQIEEALPPVDMQDANLLNDVWSRMPERFESVPVKKVIKTYVFGSWREFRALRKHSNVRRSDEKEWLLRILRYFFERVERGRAASGGLN